MILYHLQGHYIFIYKNQHLPGKIEENHDTSEARQLWFKVHVDVFQIKIRCVTAERDWWDVAEQDGSAQPGTKRYQERKELLDIVTCWLVRVMKWQVLVRMIGFISS
jgi:hypothetical protein